MNGNDDILMQATVRGTAETHNLTQRGSTPRPATSFEEPIEDVRARLKSESVDVESFEAKVRSAFPSLKKAQVEVQEWMKKAGQECPDKPTIASEEVAYLRYKLINEEFTELQTGMDLEQLVTIADAIGDLLYVVLGTAVAYGIDMEPVWHEIHRSNMTKFIDGQRREDGKWIKGPSYSPANLRPIIETQMNKKSEDVKP